jgi:hypothetical protein
MAHFGDIMPPYGASFVDIVPRSRYQLPTMWAATFYWVGNMVYTYNTVIMFLFLVQTVNLNPYWGFFVNYVLLIVYAALNTAMFVAYLLQGSSPTQEWESTETVGTARRTTTVPGAKACHRDRTGVPPSCIDPSSPLYYRWQGMAWDVHRCQLLFWTVNMMSALIAGLSQSIVVWRDRNNSVANLQQYSTGDTAGDYTVTSNVSGYVIFSVTNMLIVTTWIFQTVKGIENGMSYAHAGCFFEDLLAISGTKTSTRASQRG